MAKAGCPLFPGISDVKKFVGIKRCFFAKLKPHDGRPIPRRTGINPSHRPHLKNAGYLRYPQ
jgi:hypothetical protein